MKKRLALSILILGVITGVFMAPAVALADTWTDISDAQWQNTYGVTAAQVDTVADGYPDGSFKPANSITRAQFTKMAVSGLGVAQKSPVSPTFSDVPKSNIFYPYIEGAAAAGLVNGTGNGRFSPNSPITRQNVAAILGRYLSAAELKALGHIAGSTGTQYVSLEAWYAAEGSTELAKFVDKNQVGANMRIWVAYLASREIAQGSNGYFNPLSNITRAQSAVLVLRVLATANAFGKEDLPTITSISPTGGPSSGGTVVTINGTNFTSGATVKFGTAGATNVNVLSATKITATSPAGTAGATVQVSVTTAAGTSANTAADDFTYSAVPTITALDPSAGAAAGGESVVITGTNFTSDAIVKFGTKTVPAADVTYTSPTKLTAVAPAGTVNTTVDVSVTTPLGTSANTQADDYAYGRPVVSSISPQTGPAAGGTTVTINGTGFTLDVTVKFGTVTVPSANVTVNSPTKITVTSPAGTAGKTVQVSVTNDEGTSSDTEKDNFTYAGTGPNITSLTPAAGDPEGGDEVVIKGYNFPTDEDDELAIYFGTVPVDEDDIDLDTATQLTVEAPEPVQEYTVVDVIIVTEAGTSPNTPADDYSYGEPVIEEITPAVGDPKGGYEIVITGTGFTPDVKVYWDGDALDGDEFTVDNPTRITVTVPKGDDGDSVDVMVENDGGESNEEEFEYNGDLPYITSISPTAGDAGGGDTVYITGLNFPTDEDDLTVSFGGEEVDEDDITALTSTKITVKAPAPLEAGDDVTEVVDVSVKTDEGTSPNTPADDYSYGRARIESIEPNTGDTDGGTVVTITGWGFVKGITVYFGSTTVDAGNATLVSPTEIRVIAPAGEDGDEVLVKVKNAEGTSKDSDSNDDEFTYDEDYGAPVVEGVYPNEGVAAGGTEVTITGSNFTRAARVYFGTNEAEDVTCVSPTELKAVSPAGTQGKRVHVKVTVGDQSSDTDYDTDAFTYYEDGDPTVESLNGEDVAYGPKKGGNTLTIIGSGFSSKPDVKIGSKTVADENVTVLSRTKLEVIVPSITTADTVDISIENTEDDLVLDDAYVYFTIDVEYSDASTWKDMTGDTFDAGANIDIRLCVLDGDNQPIGNADLSACYPLLYYYRSTSDKKPVNPSSGTTDSDGYLHWEDSGGFTNKTYTVYVGFDVNNTANTTSSSVFTSVDTYESASWEWD